MSPNWESVTAVRKTAQLERDMSQFQWKLKVLLEPYQEKNNVHQTPDLEGTYLQRKVQWNLSKADDKTSH